MSEKKVQYKKIFEYFFSIAVIVLVLFLLLGFLFYFNIVPTPPFFADVFGLGESKVDPSYYDESEFYAFLQNNQKVADSDIKTLQITVDNAADFIKALKTCENFYWELDTVELYKDSEALYSHSVWAFDGKMRADTVSPFQNTTVVIDNGKAIVKNNKNGDVRTFEGDTDFTFESVVNIADIEFYIDSPECVMQEASLVNTENEKYLHVVFYNETLKKNDEFYISLDYGIVLFSISYIDGEKVFTQTTKDFKPDYKASSDVFKV